MKKNFLRKLIALCLSFGVFLGLPVSVFASRNSMSAFVPVLDRKPCITHFFTDCDNITYFITGVKSEGLTEDDFSIEILNNTQISGELSSNVRVCNHNCSVRVLLAAMALYIVDFSMAEIEDFIVGMKSNTEVFNLYFKFNLILYGRISHRKICTAREMLCAIVAEYE